MRELFIDDRLDEDGDLFMSFIDESMDGVWLTRLEAAELIIRFVDVFKFEPEEIIYMDEIDEKQKIKERNKAKCGTRTLYGKDS